MCSDSHLRSMLWRAVLWCAALECTVIGPLVPLASGTPHILKSGRYITKPFHFVLILVLYRNSKNKYLFSIRKKHLAFGSKWYLLSLVDLLAVRLANALRFARQAARAAPERPRSVVETVRALRWDSHSSVRKRNHKLVCDCTLPNRIKCF